jgi:hypothetical protein
LATTTPEEHPIQEQIRILVETNRHLANLNPSDPTFPSVAEQIRRNAETILQLHR